MSENVKTEGAPAPSLKYDSQKPEFFDLLYDINQVMHHGAAKYGEGNWKASMGTDKHNQFCKRLVNAALRHISAKGHTDPDSGLPHIDHAITCLYMVKCYFDYKVNESLP